ncbi:anhydro-N-acetylmuramic acid kinase [Pseudoroseicyclus aestuarii]|nr:anhydro-N-acetylmuramic acid kinase [Pseudoroseicyclus aestuarii]
MRVLGAMSGLAFDGVDAAVIETDGEKLYSIGGSGYRPYTEGERSVLRAALGEWEGPHVVSAARVVTAAHGELLSQFEGLELIGFHGQTLIHDPRGSGTLQIGDGQALAQLMGLPVVSDFRSADVQMGGEGGPMAAFYHWALARYLDLEGPVAVLNLGGIAKLTLVDPTVPRPQDEGALLAFDAGPATALVDDLVRTRIGRACDEDGVLARGGTVAEGVVEHFLQDRYFTRMAPKTLDRGTFAWMIDAVADLSDADAAATLCACSAAGVMAGLELAPQPPRRILVSGGGRRNPVLMEMIAAGADCPVEPVEDLGLDGDMIEAQSMAYLAVRVTRGMPTTAPGTTGVRAAIGGGTVNRPALLPAGKIG